MQAGACVLAVGDVSGHGLPSSGPVLGIHADVLYPRAGRRTLRPGDVLPVITDGLSEAHLPGVELFGIERVHASARAHQHLPAAEMIQAL